MLKFILVLISSILFLTSTVVAEEPKNSYTPVIALYQQDHTGSSTQFVFPKITRTLLLLPAAVKVHAFRPKTHVHKNAVAASESTNAGVIALEYTDRV